MCRSGLACDLAKNMTSISRHVDNKVSGMQMRAGRDMYEPQRLRQDRVMRLRVAASADDCND